MRLVVSHYKRELTVKFAPCNRIYRMKLKLTNRKNYAFYVKCPKNMGSFYFLWLRIIFSKASYKVGYFDGDFVGSSKALSGKWVSMSNLSTCVMKPPWLLIFRRKCMKWIWVIFFFNTLVNILDNFIVLNLKAFWTNFLVEIF